MADQVRIRIAKTSSAKPKPLLPIDQRSPSGKPMAN